MDGIGRVASGTKTEQLSREEFLLINPRVPRAPSGFIIFSVFSWCSLCPSWPICTGLAYNAAHGT